MFTLFKKDLDLVNYQEIDKLYTKFGYNNSFKYELSDYIILTWNKQNLNEPQYLIKNNSAIFVSGTPIYKNSSTLNESLDLILNDLLNDKWDYRNVRGNYSFVFSKDGKEVKIYIDQSGISNIYFDLKYEFISTSYLCCLYGINRKVTVNKNAIYEVATSGRLIGPDTLVNEVNRLELFWHKSIHNILIKIDIEYINLPTSFSNTFDEAVEEQAKEVDDYFSHISNFAKNYLVDSGLTGGHDSRMILMQLVKHLGLNYFQLHSFWRKSKDVELKVAESLASSIGKKLLTIPVKHHFDMDEVEMKENLTEAFYFYDGHVRMHCFFTEAYNTRKHRKEILDDKGLGLNGIGGEQYRNEWHIESNKWTLDYFIKYFLCYHLAGRPFTDNSVEKEYFNYLEKKIRKRLQIPQNIKTINRHQFQCYVNEVYVSSLMGARTNVEQKLGHFLSPFLDRQLTYSSYRAIKYHGVSFNFQQAMLRKMNPKLSKIISGYGYNFMEGEPIKNKLKYLIKELTPKSFYQNSLDRKFNKLGNGDFKELVSKYRCISECIETLNEMCLPVNEKIITSRPDLMPVYISLAYTLHTLKYSNKLM